MSESMKPSEAVKAVLSYMDGLNVSLLELETYGYVQGFEDDPLNVSVDEAFDRLVEDDFNYWENNQDADYWYQAGQDMVSEALSERGLMNEEE